MDGLTGVLFEDSNTKRKSLCQRVNDYSNSSHDDTSNYTTDDRDFDVKSSNKGDNYTLKLVLLAAGMYVFGTYFALQGDLVTYGTCCAMAILTIGLALD
jgi:hypothetical protein